MILLVEDENRAREVFSRILKDAGYAVMEAADGLEALSLLEDLPRFSRFGYIDAEAKRVCAGCPDSCQMAQYADNSHVRLPVPRCSKHHDERVGRIYTEAPSTLDATRFDTRPLGRRRGAGT